MVPIVASRVGMIQSRTLLTQINTPMVTTVSRAHVRIYFTVTLLRKMLPIVELQSLLMSSRLRMGITRQIFHPSILLDNALSTKPIRLSNQCRSYRVQICQARTDGGHSYFLIR